MKGYSTLPRDSELAPQNQMQFGVIGRTLLFLFFGGGAGFLAFLTGYSYRILSLINKAKNILKSRPPTAKAKNMKINKGIKIRVHF